jgi:hypothetical protein
MIVLIYRLYLLPARVDIHIINQTLSAYVGIVIKYENMSYKAALHHANQVLGLAGKASKYIKELFDAPDVSSLLDDSQSVIDRYGIESPLVILLM